MPSVGDFLTFLWRTAGESGEREVHDVAADDGGLKQPRARLFCSEKTLKNPLSHAETQSLILINKNLISLISVTFVLFQDMCTKSRKILGKVSCFCSESDLNQ